MLVNNETGCCLVIQPIQEPPWTAQLNSSNSTTARHGTTRAQHSTAQHSGLSGSERQQQWTLSRSGRRPRCSRRQRQSSNTTSSSATGHTWTSSWRRGLRAVRAVACPHSSVTRRRWRRCWRWQRPTRRPTRNARWNSASRRRRWTSCNGATRPSRARARARVSRCWRPSRTTSRSRAGAASTRRRC